MSIKSTIIISVLQITGVFISKYFRAGNPPEPLPMLNALIAEYSVFLIELIFISAISINLFKFLRIIFEEKRKASKEMLQFSLSAMEYHSKYLKIHNDGLRQIVKIILQDLAKDKKYKLNLEKCKNILFAVQVHDIGKLCVDPLILDKPGKLSSEEFELIKQHPVKGLELFRKIPSGIVEESCKAVCEIIIVEHHERLNGKGYPSGKTDISIEGQIIAVADVVDALLSWRPYKNPFDFEHMRNIITGDDGLNQDICN
ncbi:MAG: HD domain-containing protein, partial [Clostridia bacterium]|nr:HD domain-containing protein [Clostridia bacterium]